MRAIAEIALMHHLLAGVSARGDGLHDGGYDDAQDFGHNQIDKVGREEPNRQREGHEGKCPRLSLRGLHDVASCRTLLRAGGRGGSSN